MAVETPSVSSPSRKKRVVPFPSSDAKTSNDKTKRPTTDRADRTSFSSLKASQPGTTQSITDSKTSSYLRKQLDSEEATEHTLSGAATPESGEIERKLLSPCNNCGSVCPRERFRGWKEISIRGKMVSKSCEDLRAFGIRDRLEWVVNKGEKMDLDANEGLGITRRKGKRRRYPAEQSPLESLPMELLTSVIDQLPTASTPDGFTARNVDLVSLLLTSRTMHAATLATLYSQITIRHSRTFRKFLERISSHPVLGTIVRCLDFSHFNPIGIAQNPRERAQTLNLAPQTLLQCLSLTPDLREFLAQEHIDEDLSADVLRTLLCSLPKLKALDFCACSSSSFRDAFNAAISTPLPLALPMTRLSLHECAVLPSLVFEALLPRLSRLTHLDVSHTRITDEALHLIPTSARLTHLNLSKCSSLSSSSVVKFLSTHPAAKSLVYLNLAMDVKSHEMLSAGDVTNLLRVLPPSLRSLNLKGSKMDASHIRDLIPLSKHVEELGLGRHLTLYDITQLFIPDQEAELEKQIAWTPHALRYIDISDLSAYQLDFSILLGSSSPILKGVAYPLEVLELSAEVFKKLEKNPVVKRAGWRLKEAGRRGLLVRESGFRDGGRDDGKRDWKCSASYWGMRKVPVARAEVGGMYGYYMFKR